MQRGAYRAIFRDVADEERRELEERERHHGARKGLGVTRGWFCTPMVSWQAAVGKPRDILVLDLAVYIGIPAVMKVREEAAQGPRSGVQLRYGSNDAAVISRNGRWVADRR